MKNKINCFIQYTLIFFCLHIFTNDIQCVYRQEAYKIFDKFTLVDLQYDKKSCTMTEGPNCFQLANIYEVYDSEYLQKIIERLYQNQVEELNLDVVIKGLTKELNRFKEKNKASMNEVFKFSPKILMNLLLNFESFDQATKLKDAYMPEEKIINFNTGYLKVNFKGKLRLTQEKENMMKTRNKNLEAGPMGTYGVIEDKDLYIKFDKPVVIKYLYIRPHFLIKDNRMKATEMSVVGYRNEQLVINTKMHLMANSREWVKVTPNQSIIDTLKLPKDFDIDDISISHDSEYSGPSENEAQLTSILQNVIDELMDQQKKVKHPDDL